MYSSRLLIAAVHHLYVFEELATSPLSIEDLQTRLGLKERPAMVLFPALCAMGMLAFNRANQLQLTDLGTCLTYRANPNLAAYVGLEKSDPAVLEMVERLKNDGPLKTPTGIAYIKEGEGPSPMDDPETSRSLTLALAGRAQLLAPIVAHKLPRHNGHLLDIAGGSGFFTYEWLLANPEATATVLDRPQVLTVAAECLDTFSRSNRSGADTVPGRVTLLPGDMLTDELPEANLILAASLFHDWPTETCRLLAQRFANTLKPGGELWVHDAFLNDALDGPQAVTDYSAQLFWVTKGRAYSRREYRQWFTEAGLVATTENISTQLDYGLIRALKP
ncbi:methyltransferase [Nibrella saemangeumensis]|uniref:Methyltransferase n=2 Tax=Nibrella saemangeumensis TaxID=1084526 RepID=A0ABP8N3Y4_9BACT